MATRARTIGLYVAMMAAALTVMWLIAREGDALRGRAPAARVAAVPSGDGAAAVPLSATVQRHIGHNAAAPVSVLLLQITVILLVARAVGAAARAIGQPTVIGEIVAGILLGPSLLGAVAPGFSAFVFPAASLNVLQLLSQVGLLLFMFIVGMHLDVRHLAARGHHAVVVSHASIVVPFILGMGLAYAIYARWAPAGIDFLSFALFLGIALSITAFPVLARILQERNLTHTPLGAMALSCAAADDITAWCLLAAVTAIAKAGSTSGAAVTLTLGIAFVLVMTRVVGPLLARLAASRRAASLAEATIVAAALLVLFVAAYAAELIGIHALFGAFVAGGVMPRRARVVETTRQRIEDVAVVLLLPIFFALTGLRTQIGLLDSASTWTLCGVVLVLAIAGKLVGSAVAARMVGCSWGESLSIGALMNTRGLMELIALNIGHDLGILDARLFAIFVIMALVTTFMAGPLLDGINRLYREPAAAGAASYLGDGPALDARMP